MNRVCEINENKLSWIKDQKQKIKEFRDQQIPNYLTQTSPDGYSVDKDSATPVIEGEKWAFNLWFRENKFV